MQANVKAEVLIEEITTGFVFIYFIVVGISDKPTPTKLRVWICQNGYIIKKINKLLLN